MQSSTPNCPRCGQPLTYVYQYQQWYCPAEGVYPWASQPAQQAQPAQAQAAEPPKAAPQAAPQAAAPAKETPSAQPAAAQAPTQAAAQTHACPRCGKPLTYVHQYQQWYCPAEGVYPWASQPAQQAQPAQAQAAEPPKAATAEPAQQAASSQACPRCGKPLTYAYQYQRWYCPAEGVYPWG